jgi:hypothetical protein
MAELVPLKAVYNGSNVCGLSELRDGDVVGVEHGGLGVCTLAANSLLIGNTQGSVTTTSALTNNGQIIIGGASGPAVANLSGTSNEVDITNGDGTIQIGLPAAVIVTTSIKSPAICVSSQYALPAADGSAGQIMCTDGSGALSFVAFDGSGHCIAFGGSTVTDRTCLNFVGGGVTVSDNSGTNATDVTIAVTTPELKVRNTSGTELGIQLDNTAIGGELICDTTPQLGGTLDVNGYAISSVSDGNIAITPHGDGAIVLDGLSWPIADGTAGYILCTNGSGSLAWAVDSAGGSAAGSNNEIQYNNSGSFGASSNLTFDGSALTVTGTADVSGDFTAGTVNADGDTSAGDNAAMGYTAAEGLILTGQGSTSDVTLKNDADATVLSIPTGTTNVGIGTTAAIQPLHVVTSSGANVLFQLNADSGENTYAARRSRGSAGSPTAIQTDDTILALGAEGYDGSTYAGRAQLKVLAAENWSGSARGTKFAFYGATAGQGGLDSDPWVTMKDGNVGIGTTSPNGAVPTGTLASSKILKVDGGTGVDAAVQIVGHDTNHGLDLWTDVSTGDVYIDQRGNHNDYDMRFRTKTTGTPVDAMVITGQGLVHIGDSDAPSDYLDVSVNSGGGRPGRFTQKASNGNILALEYSGVTPDNNTQMFLTASDGTANRAIIYSDGDVWTSDAGTLTSDERLKTNIVDASDKLADVMKLQVRNYEWTPEYHPNKVSEKKIGFIAQELETVFPALVSEHDIAPDNAIVEQLYDANDDIPAGKAIGDVKVAAKDHEPTMRKAYKDAFTPILVKALQEVTARLEAAEAKIATLESA